MSTGDWYPKTKTNWGGSYTWDYYSGGCLPPGSTITPERIIMDDPTEPLPPNSFDAFRKLLEELERQRLGAKEEELKKLFKKSTKEVDIMNLYRVYMVYGGNRNSVEVVTTGSTVARDPEDAKIKSGIYQKIDPTWDAEFVTIIVEQVGEVKVKAKAQEVKQV